MDSILQILKRLNDHQVDFVVVGGVAAALHGSVRVTVDVFAPLDEANVSRILDSLRGTNPKFRMHPNKLPVPDDPARLRGFRNLCLDTDIGIVDILGEVTGIGTFQEARARADLMDVGGFTLRVLDLEGLIVAKKAAGRRKDREAVIELELIRERVRRQQDHLST